MVLRNGRCVCPDCGLSWPARESEAAFRHVMQGCGGSKGRSDGSSPASPLAAGTDQSGAIAIPVESTNPRERGQRPVTTGA